MLEIGQQLPFYPNWFIQILKFNAALPSPLHVAYFIKSNVIYRDIDGTG